MGIPEFLTDVLESALDQGIGTPSDVLRHATPEELSKHLPRNVWAALLTEALTAARTDARLVVDTVTIATICQHLPAPVLWNCVAELGGRSLSKPLVSPPPTRVATIPPPVAEPARAASTAREGGREPARETGSQGKKGPPPSGGKPGKRPPPTDDDIEIDLADERKPEAVAVDDEQLIDWAQSEEQAAQAEVEREPAPPTRDRVDTRRPHS